MTSVFYTIAKYLILIFFAFFVLASFRVQRDLPMEKLKKGYNNQRAIILIIQALCYISIIIKIIDGTATEVTVSQILLFWLCQAAYVLVIGCILPRLLPLNRGLNNCVLMFLTIGLVVQTRLGYSSAVRQFVLLLGGTVLYILFCILVKKIKFARNLKWVYCIAALVLLILVLVLSTTSRGAKTYIDLGFITFQPLEFVKILFVLFLAAFFYKDKSYKTVLITGIFAAADVIILVVCNDLGGALILAVIYVLMVYAAKKDWKILLIGAVGLAAAAVFSYFAFSHVQIRIEAWLDPFSDVAGNGYQIAQSLFAIGTGGWFGLGIYGGAPSTIPEVSNDMVFAAICEEFGVIFGILLILLWLCFILMIIRVSLRVSNIFYKLVCFGMGLAFGVQVFLNIGGTIKFIPLTGVNLPFISRGGSSLFASMIMIGIVQALYVISEVDMEIEREQIAESLSRQSMGVSAGGAYAASRSERRRKTSERVTQVNMDENENGNEAGNSNIGRAGPKEETYEEQIARKVQEIDSENRLQASETFQNAGAGDKNNKKEEKKKVTQVDPEDL